jgi:hypothetical protein
MNEESFTTTLSVDESPDCVFAAAANVRGWWSSDIEGVTDTAGAEFIYRYQDIHFSKQLITEFNPNERIVWKVQDAFLNFTKDPKEWIGTEIIFEVCRRSNKTELCFTHKGLTPTFECYDACSDAWSFYIGESLKNLILTGTGKANE